VFDQTDGRVYDIVTNKLIDDVRDEFPDVGDDRKREYWRCVLSMAALCHNIGHLPSQRNYPIMPDGTIEERADELMEIKTHVDLSGAVAAVREVDEIIDQAQALVH